MKFERLWKLLASMSVWMAERRSATAALWRRRAEWFLARATNSGGEPRKD